MCYIKFGNCSSNYFHILECESSNEKEIILFTIQPQKYGHSNSATLRFWELNLGSNGIIYYNMYTWRTCNRSRGWRETYRSTSKYKGTLLRLRVIARVKFVYIFSFFKSFRLFRLIDKTRCAYPPVSININTLQLSCRLPPPFLRLSPPYRENKRRQELGSDVIFIVATQHRPYRAGC